LFPQALGGTKRSRFLYCSACNVRLGREVDAPFAAGFEEVTTTLDIRRDRGEVPTLKTTTTDGKPIFLGPGGVPTARGPSPTVIEDRGGKKHITIVVPADRPDLADQMLNKVAKELGVDRASIPLPTISLTTTPAGSVDFQLAVGGPDQSRAVAKIAFSFLALELGDTVFSPAYERLRLAVERGSEVRAWLRPAFRDLQAPMLPDTDGAQHRVIIYSTSTETWGHVEVYGTFGYAVLLAEEPDENFIVPYVWGQNPMTGESGDGYAPGTPLPTPSTRPVSPLEEHQRELMAVMADRMFDIAHQMTLAEELELAYATLGDGEELSEGAFNVMTRRMAERLVTMSMPGNELSISRPVADRQELDLIRRALERAVKHHKKPR
jgi:hypothetical protein